MTRFNWFSNFSYLWVNNNHARRVHETARHILINLDELPYKTTFVIKYTLPLSFLE